MNFKYTCLIVLIALVSCAKKERTNIQILGHAGFGLASQESIYHSNSKESIDLALATNECNGFEVDVRISADSTLWLFHDSDLSTNTTGSGCVEQAKHDDLKKVKYKGVKNQKAVDLQSIVGEISAGKIVFLDLKHFNECENKEGDPAIWNTLLSKLQIKHLSNLYLITNQIDIMEELLKANWQVLLSLDNIPTIDEQFSKHSKLKGVVIRQTFVSQEQVYSWQQKGKSVYLYGVKIKSDFKKSRSLLPNGILSDDVFGSIIELR